MAKSRSPEVDDLPSPRIASPPGPKLMLAYRLLKAVSIALGFVATMIGLSACIGALTENVYARVIGALVVTIAVPLGIADRLLPKDDPKRAKGIVTEVMAVTWVLFGFVFATAANSATRGLLVREGDRLQKGGHEWGAQAAYFLAGVRPQIAPAPAPDPSSSPSATATASESTTGLAATATASASASATASASASVTAATAAAPKAEKPEKTPSELFKELAPMVVTILFTVGDRDGGGGTGFVIDKDGTIVTNHHVIKNAKSVRIKLYSGTFYEDVELLVDDAPVDLAILKIDPAKPTSGQPAELGAVTLGDSDTVVVGERAISIGNPLGLEHTLTDGLVSSRRTYEGRAWIQMSVPVSPGNSGGPLFNMRGEVVGITTAQLGGEYARAQNLNLAVPVNELKKRIAKQYPNRRKIGEAGGAGRW